jgi:hypothetical protein
MVVPANEVLDIREQDCEAQTISRAIGVGASHVKFAS